MISIRDNQKCFEPPQHPVGPPVLCKLNRSPRYVALVSLEFTLEPFEEGKSVGSGPRKTSEDFVIIHSPYLPCIVLQHSISHGHLSVAGHGNTVIPPDT